MNDQLYRQFFIASRVMLEAKKFDQLIDESKLRLKHASDEWLAANDELEKRKKDHKDFNILVFAIMFPPIIIVLLPIRIIQKIKFNKDKKNQLALMDELGKRMDEVLLQEDEFCKKVKRDQSKFLKEHLSELSFLPPDYHNLYAIGYMMTLIRTCRADSLKEVINLYEEEQYRLNMLEKTERANKQKKMEAEYISTILKEIAQQQAEINQTLDRIDLRQQSEYYNNL